VRSLEARNQSRVAGVNDMASYFPLSNRPRRDEADVTNNWSRHRGTVLLELAALLDGLAPEEWEAPALVPSMTVRDTVAELVWRSTTTRLSRLRARRPSGQGAAELASDVRRLATDDLAAASKRRLGELSDAVVAACEIAAATGHPVSIDAVATGAVALAQGLGGPVGIRALTSERTLVATDAEWRVGRGPALEGTAAAIILYMFGRAPLSR
jgi:hypothetical protein